MSTDKADWWDPGVGDKRKKLKRYFVYKLEGGKRTHIVILGDENLEDATARAHAFLKGLFNPELIHVEAAPKPGPKPAAPGKIARISS